MSEQEQAEQTAAGLKEDQMQEDRLKRRVTMTGQEIRDIVKEKCKLTKRIEKENPGLRVFAVDVHDLPLDALREYAKLSGEVLEYFEYGKQMRIHYSHHPVTIFLHSSPVKVETHIVEDYAVKNI